MAKYTRPIDNNFQIDGVSMPKPHKYLVNYKPMSADAERLIGNGRLVIPYLTTVYEITWEYSKIEEEQYDLIFNQYVKNTTKNKSFYHTIKTKDSNGGIIETEIYTQGDFTAPLARIDPITGNRIYENIKFIFVSLGGDD